MEKTPARTQTTRAMLMLPVLWRTPPGETKIPLPMIEPTITVTPFNIVIVFFRPTAFGSASSGACTSRGKGLWGVMPKSVYLHLDHVLLRILLAYHTVVFGGTVGSHLGNLLSLEKIKFMFQWLRSGKRVRLDSEYMSHVCKKGWKLLTRIARSDMLWLLENVNVSEYTTHLL